MKRKVWVEHTIELEPKVKPIKQRHFPISPALEKIIHSEMDEMLKLDVIEESPQSPWKAFWQIPLAENSRDLTCFTVPNRPL